MFIDEIEKNQLEKVVQKCYQSQPVNLLNQQSGSRDQNKLI